MISPFSPVSARCIRSARSFLFFALSMGGAIAVAQSAKRLQAIELVKEASTVFGRGDLSLVIKICRQAVTLDPTYPRSYTWLGAAYQRRGETESACAAFSRVVKLSPKSADAKRAARGLRELGCHVVINIPRQLAPVTASVPVSGVPMPGIDLPMKNHWQAASGIASLSFSRDGTQLSAGGSDGTWRLWRTSDGRLDRLERGENYEAGASASSPSYFAVGYGQGKIRFFDARDGRDAGHIGARSGSISGLAYSPDGNLLAVAGADGALKLLDGHSNLLRRQMPGEGFLVSSVAFSPDGRFIAAGIGSVVRVYEAQSGRLIRVLAGDGLPLGALAWSRTGTLIAGALGSKIRVWSARDGRLLRVLSGHRLAVSSLVFATDTTLVSGGYDAGLRLWNAQNGTSLGVFLFHKSHIRALSVDGSGKTLASADQNGWVGIWRLP